MPRYDYRCSGCNREREVVRSYHDPGRSLLMWCPCCQKETYHERCVPREMVFHLKGEGFYTTDNRDEHEKYLFKHFD